MALRRRRCVPVNKSTIFGVILGAVIVLCLNKLYEHKEDFQQLKEYYVNKLNTLKQQTQTRIVVPVRRYDNANSLNTYQKVYDVSECRDKPLEPSFKQRGEHWVLYNYVKAEKNYKCYESVTYSTQGDYSFLDNLITIVDRWRGPISIALYAPGDDFQASLDSIAYMRNCETPMIKKYVTFHLFFDYRHLPKGHDIPLRNLYKDTYNCNKGAPYSVSGLKTYRTKANLTYPINVARNIARENAPTHFVLASDIELYPTRHFIQKFFAMVAKKVTLFQNLHPKIFVLPVFEIKEGFSIPENKTELQMMFKNNQAFLFHSDICPQCHQVIDGDEWMEAQETKTLDIFTVGKRLGKYKSWEAFYVGTGKEPSFDERLTWEGQSNKMTQAYSLCLLDYDYMVLDNAFLIHRPGIKTEKVQMKKFSNLIDETKRLISTVIKYELNVMYGVREGCKL